MRSFDLWGFQSDSGSPAWVLRPAHFIFYIWNERVYDLVKSSDQTLARGAFQAKMEFLRQNQKHGFLPSKSTVAVFHGDKKTGLGSPMFRSLFVSKIFEILLILPSLEKNLQRVPWRHCCSWLNVSQFISLENHPMRDRIVTWTQSITESWPELNGSQNRDLNSMDHRIVTSGGEFKSYRVLTGMLLKWNL